MKKKWIVPALVLLVVAGAVGAAYMASRPKGNDLYATVMIEAVSKTQQGVELDSDFSVSLGYAVSQDELRAMLHMEPEMGDFVVRADNNRGRAKAWTLTPGVVLEDNTVYSIQVLNPDTKETVQSFAFQTKSDLHVGGVYPGNGESYIPIDTGIEFTFNAQNVDLKDHFAILPEVAGSFETNGYTTIFKPDEPLTPNSIYRVTLKAGLSAPDGMKLMEDYHFSFETESDHGGRWDYTQLRLAGEYAESFLPGDPVAVAMTSGTELAGLEFEVKVHQYGDISGYSKELMDHDAFYANQYGERTDYVANTTGLEEVTSYTGELSSGPDGWNYYAFLPDNLPEGHYIVTVSGKNAEGTQQFVQKLIQVSNMSVYVQSVDGDTITWVNDANTGGPVAGMGIVFEDAPGNELEEPQEKEAPAKRQEATTLEDGTAHLMTGESSAVYLSLSKDGKSVYFSREGLSKEEKEKPLEETYYTALYTDRSIYQPDDTIRFWGVVKPRSLTAEVPPEVVLTIGSDWPEQSDLYRVKAQVDEQDGTFSGSMEITGTAQGSYRLAVTNGKEGTYTATYLPVEHYTKPAYKIEVSTERESYYLNEEIKFLVNAHYFDGTPAKGLKLRFSGSYLEETVLTLDENGQVQHTAPLDTVEWLRGNDNKPSWEPRRIWYGVSNLNEEYVETGASGTVWMIPSAVAAKIESEHPDSFTLHTAALDVSKIGTGAQVRPLARRVIYDDQYDSLAGAAVDLPVQVDIHRVTYVKIPRGEYYDYVNKRSVQLYDTEEEDRVVQTVTGTTKGGKLTVSDLPYTDADEDGYYWLEAKFAGNISGDVWEQFYYFQPYRYAREEERYAFVPPDEDSTAKGIGEQITLGLYRNGRKVENLGSVLCSAIQRKSLTTSVYRQSEVQIEMVEDYLPNVYFAGAYFDGRHIYSIEPYRVSYDYTSKALTIDAQTDKEAYRPGESAAITLTLTDAQGSPAAGSAVVGVVDEALFEVMPQNLNLLDALYRDIYHPYIMQSQSYRSYEETAAQAMDGAPSSAKAVANSGGGGPEAEIREEFVDTALFQTVQVDETGKATVQMVLPDNVTSWRITAAAVTADLKAGNSTHTTAATLPFYLTPLITSRYLEGDDVSMAVGAVGTEVHTGDEVQYTVTISDTAGTELDKLQGTGKAGQRTAFNFGKYDAGQYVMLVSGSSGGKNDAVKQAFSVIKQGITVPVVETMPLEELNSLVSVRYPVRLQIYDNRMKPYMEAVEKLSGQSGQRTEIIAASYLANTALNELLPPEQRESIRRDSRLENIQDGETGGVKLLPHSGPDAAITAKMLVAAPKLINVPQAKGFLQDVLKNPAATPDDRVMAYMGLAAAKQPILLDLIRYLEQEGDTLTPAQKLYLGVGIAKLGDFTTAGKVYQSLSGQIKSESGMKYIDPDGTLEVRLQTTSAALMLTSVISNVDADALLRYLNIQGDNERNRTDKVLYNLEMLTYLEHYTMPSSGSAAKGSYTDLEGQAQTLSFTDKGVIPMTLSAQALRAAEFKKESGELYAAVRYEGYADALQETNNSKVTVEKTYTPIDSDTIGVTGRVRVDIKLTFAPDAPEGCYLVTDNIPSGMRYLSERFTGGTEWLWGNMRNEGQQVRGYVYRTLPQPEKQPRAAQLEAGDEPPVADTAEEPAAKVIPNSQAPEEGEAPEDQNTYTITYFVSAILPGEFVTESAYVTPHVEGVAAKTQRGKLAIAPAS